MTKRINAHIIDTKAIKKVFNILPDHWVIRELSERDYGIDLMVEIFSETDKDRNNKNIYESTGYVLNIQVKGTDTPLKFSKNNTIDFRLHRKHLMYFEKFSIPFLIFRVDNSEVDSKKGIYFAWIQKYIKKRLNIESPEWRTESRKHTSGKFVGQIKAPKYKIELPGQNLVYDKLYRIEEIASNPKYLEELSEFVEIFTAIENLLENIRIGFTPIDNEIIKYLVNQTSKLRLLDTLIKRNNCGLSKEDFTQLYLHFFELKCSQDYTEIQEFPKKEEFNRLLKAEALSILTTEEFEEEMCGTTAY